MSNLQQGELVVDALTIVNPEGDTIDISGITTSIKIFESIDKPFLSGRLSIVDGLDIIKNFKLVGQESLTMKIRQREGTEGEFSDTDNSIDKVFRIYSLTNIQPVNDLTKSYVLHIVDPKFFTCQKTVVSKTYRGSYSSILLKALREDGGFGKLRSVDDLADYWEESKPENQQFICPNWNLNKVIKYCTENANYGEDASWQNSMFFFQTLNGSFRFVSFDTMCREMEFPLRFSYYPRNAKLDTEEIDINAPDVGLNSQILDYQFPQKFNTMKGVQDGAYASMLKTYDPIRKLEEENVYSISKVFDRNAAHVSGFPLIRASDLETIYEAEEMLDVTTNPDSKEAFVDLAPDQAWESKTHYRVNPTNAYSDESKLIDATDGKSTTQPRGNEYRDTGILERKALLSLFEQNVIKATIPFRSDISVGSVVRLTLPTTEIKTDSDDGDKLEDGKYLIGKLVFFIDPINNKGSVTMQTIKESYGVDIKSYSPLSQTSEPEEV